MHKFDWYQIDLLKWTENFLKRIERRQEKIPAEEQYF